MQRYNDTTTATTCISTNAYFTTGLRVFMDGIDGATSVAQTSGGGGTSSDMPWRDKDEDYLHWAYRAMRYAHAKHYPGNKLKRSLSK